MSLSTKDHQAPEPLGKNEGEEEDDYMTMTFDDAPAQPETSLQRRQREKKEAARRATVKSKAQLAAEELEKRESALSRSLLEDPSRTRKSKGFAMMAKMGFKPGSGLGPRGSDGKDGEGGEGGEGGRDGRDGREPIRISVKEDRGGIGLDGERKRALKESAEAAGFAKKPRIDEGDYRERMAREREAARNEKQFYAAQRIAERMEDEAGTAVVQETEGRDEEEKEKKKEKPPRAAGMPASSSRPLKSINVLWRGLVRAWEEAERDRRMRHDLEQSSSRLPSYVDEHEDDDDKTALGKKTETVYATAQDLDDEDTELEEFTALDPGEKLRRIVEHLRTQFHYCFWCKHTYPDSTMDGCPGPTEEDHD